MPPASARAACWELSSTAFVCATLAAAMVVSVRNAALRIAVRVAASWLAAVGVLAVGWTLKG